MDAGSLTGCGNEREVIEYLSSQKRRTALGLIVIRDLL